MKILDQTLALACSDCGFRPCLCGGIWLPAARGRVSNSRLDAAGTVLKTPIPEANAETVKGFKSAFDCVAQWRDNHSFPLQHFEQYLRRHAHAVNGNALITTRLKRMRSIIAKLERERSRVSQLQDIVGCRAVVPTVSEVRHIVRRLKRANVRHELLKVHNYIDHPKQTGYRSVHLVYRFNMPALPAVDKMLCEIQVRTFDQHAWACAVEAAGFFRNEDLKSGVGDSKWLRLFSLAGAAVAINESCVRIPGMPEEIDTIYTELHQHMDDLNVLAWLSGFQYGLVARHLTRKKNAYWFLLKFNSETYRLEDTAYTAQETVAAFAHYREEEASNRDNKDVQVVLVSADDMKGVRAGYPSFFGNRRQFRRIMSKLLAVDWKPAV